MQNVHLPTLNSYYYFYSTSCFVLNRNYNEFQFTFKHFKSYALFTTYYCNNYYY